MTRLILSFLTLAFVFFGFSNPALSDIPTLEKEALIALYDSTNGDDWTEKSGWEDAISGTECTWYGVTCSGESVIKIDLVGNHLTGNIPPELGNLAHLEYFYAGVNQLTGSIPPELANLSHLKELAFDSNQLTGCIPPELGNMADLEMLFLNENQLNGTIPVEVGNLSNLQDLRISDNRLTGGIPPEFGNLTSLTTLYVDTNQLSGSIPIELMNLSNLSTLSICDNHLSADDENLKAWLDGLQPGWEGCQTPHPISLPSINLLLFAD